MVTSICSSVHATDPAGTVIGWGSVDWFGLTLPRNVTNVVAVVTRSRHGLALNTDGIVLGWGDNFNDFGAPTPPSGLSNVVEIATGAQHSLALKSDGTIVGWGNNFNGQVTPPSGLTNVIAIAAGGYHSLALTPDGRVWGWGAQGANLPANLTNVIAIGAGELHSLAVSGDGTVVAWGDNSFGQCNVPAGLTGVTAVAGGLDHSLALKNDGTVVAWGDGSVQTNYPSGLNNIVAIAAGGYHNLALRDDGTVLGWGDNLFGPLDGPGAYTNLLGIAAGYGVSFGITRQPVIVDQPVSATVLAGTNITFQVGVIGTVPWSYQWFYNGTQLVGETFPNLRLTNVQVADSGTFSVLVSNQFGGIFSSPAHLVVQPYPPSITVQPTNQVLLAGGAATFAVSAEGAPPLRYQWYFSGGAISGATNATRNLSNVSELDEGRYQVTVSNAYGTNRSAEVYLTVNYPPAVTNTPLNLAVPAGTNLILRVFAEGNEPLYYQWRFRGTTLLTSTYTSIVLANVQSADAGEYSVVVSNAFGVVTNTVYTLSVVDSPPFIYQQPTSQAFQPGGTVVLRVLASGTAPLSFQWWHGAVPIAAATNSSLALTDLQASDAGDYFLAVTNAFGFTNSARATLSIGDPFPGEVDWPSFNFTQVTTNTFSFPTCISHAGDGSERLFLVEQAGRVRTVYSNHVLPDVFLDITDRVRSGGERGLLGIAFPREFGSNRHFYLNYTRKPDGATVISRFLMSTNSNVADTNSEQVLKVIPQPFANHNGGQLAFGPDGYLYIGMGDGGFPFPFNPDPNTNGQSPSSLLGKLLRIHVEGGFAPYAVPTNNPFFTNAAYAPEIWALGLRNPWRFSFDRLTGDLYIGDVGHDRYEEIDFQPGGSAGGHNYGWRVREGPAPLIQPPAFDLSTLTEPVTWYGRQEGASVTGGYVYRGPNAPRMNGIYFFGDFVSGRIWGLKAIGTNWQRFKIADTAYAISTFGEDEQGRLFLADYYNGRIYQIQDSNQVWEPAFSPANGVLYSNAVTVTCPTPGALIHYTTDGRDPSEFDPGVPSGETIVVSSGRTAKIRAFRPDLMPSAVVSALFAFKVGTPTFSPAQGPITNGTLVRISTLTPGATIRYTLDGTTPDTSSLAYDGPITLRGNSTLTARGFLTGFGDSDVRQQFFVLVSVATPVFTPLSGPIIHGTSISISCATPDAVIHYTLDGSQPTTNSPTYSGPLVINGNVTVSAQAYKPDYLDSAVQSVFYSLVKVAVPIFNPSQGPLTNGARISISSPTSNTLIRYTLDGSEPDTNSPAYSTPLPFNGPITLKARAYRADLDPSEPSTVFYGLLDYENTVVTTVAGGPIAAFSNGFGTLARFSSPQGICIDRFHNLYVADTGNNVVRKILPSGQVTTFAGTGVAGSQLGHATNAQFSGPTGVCVDNSGNVYVADSGNCNRICKIDTNGTVTVFANVTQCGPGIGNYAPGLWQLEADPAGNIYVGHWARLVKIPPDGTPIGLAGTGCACPGGWGLNVGVGIDLLTNIYAATSSLVWKIAPDGSLELFAGGSLGFSDGPRLLSLFQGPQDAAVSSTGNIFVSDATRVRRIRPDGWVSTFAGSGVSGYVNGSASSARFNYAAGLCLDGEGNVYVADVGNNSIRKIWVDIDGDAIPDSLEGAATPYVVGVDDRAVDSDHDGMSNSAEFEAGTDPLDPKSFLAVDSLRIETDGHAVIRWGSTAGKYYVVKYSDDLVVWSVVGIPVLGDGSLLSVMDPSPVQTTLQRTYRVFLADF